jgi:hypothetical protein
MKLSFVIAAVPILLSSCLKQSIPDAMLASKNPGGQGGATATLSYKVNGNAVNISVTNAGSQDPTYYTLGCTKSGDYSLEAQSTSGELTFTFYTDSLTIGNYIYTGTYGDMYFMRFNGQDEYAQAASDSLSFNITAYKNGLISGNFSGQLTPLISAGNPYNTYGASGSTLITNGSFKNIPVFY